MYVNVGIIALFSEYLNRREQFQILPVIVNEGHSQQILDILELDVLWL